MGLFNRKQKPDMNIESHHDTRVEVVVHKNAAKDAVVKAKEANKHLNELLVQNGFTLKIYLAAGGKPPKTKNTRGKP